jgi:hypothetical protein
MSIQSTTELTVQAGAKPPSFGRSFVGFVLSTTGVSVLLMLLQAGY